VMGTGNTLRASATPFDPTVTKDASVTVIAGGCDACEIVPLRLLVVDGMAEWQSKIGVEYLFLVQAKSDYVCVIAELAANDECKNAEPIVIGSEFTGAFFSSEDVWFKIIGKGGLVGENACNGPPFLSIFTGPCDRLVEVEKKSFECSDIWFLADGVEYLVLMRVEDITSSGSTKMTTLYAVEPEPVSTSAPVPSTANPVTNNPTAKPTTKPTGQPIAWPKPTRQPIASPPPVVAPPGCVAKCVLVNLATRVEMVLGDSGTNPLYYVPNPAGRQRGHSIRCDTKAGQVVSRISFGYNGGVHKETSGPYWMFGNSRRGSWVNDVAYLKSCGPKSVTVWAESSPKVECYRQSFTLESKCSTSTRGKGK
jgi:hypothetical protein